MDDLSAITDPADAGAGSRVEWGTVRAELAHETMTRATAELWAACADVLDAAASDPSVFVDPEQPMPAAERREFAVRAAVADLAVRLSISEPMVRAFAFDATTLRGSLPKVWDAFATGRLGAIQVRGAAELVRSLPDDPELHRQFDDALQQVAALAPGRFRARARVLRDRIHSVSLAERVKAATETRGVWVENDVDGMAYLTMKLPAEIAHSVFTGIDDAARTLKLPDETRTLAQLRADVAADILTGAASNTHGTSRVNATVAVTVPVMTLLGLSEEPGTLDGYGPIDADTARRIAGHAPSFTRLLTHPISGTLLDIDRGTYRIPADLRRWLQITDVTCRFPGCTRPARRCDIDHTLDAQHGGPTNACNLACLCRHHHRIKHNTRWTLTRGAPPRKDHDPGARTGTANANAGATPRPGAPTHGTRATLTWTSPTGHTRTDDPPPF